MFLILSTQAFSRTKSVVITKKHEYTRIHMNIRTTY